MEVERALGRMMGTGERARAMKRREDGGSMLRSLLVAGNGKGAEKLRDLLAMSS